METSEKFKELKSQLMLYLESKVELYRLEAIDHSTYLLSFVIGLMIVIAIMLIFLVSLGFFLGHLLGELLGNDWMGFALVSLFYLITLLICYWRFRKMIQEPLQNLLINKIDQYYEEKGK